MAPARYDGGTAECLSDGPTCTQRYILPNTVFPTNPDFQLSVASISLGMLIMIHDYLVEAVKCLYGATYLSSGRWDINSADQQLG